MELNRRDASGGRRQVEGDEASTIEASRANVPAGASAVAHKAGGALNKVQAHLNRWLLAYVLGAIGLGLVVGASNSRWVSAHQSSVALLTNVAVFLIVYPMMINLKLEALLKAGKNAKGLTLTALYNFMWAPLIGLLLATIFLRDPLLTLGFLLVMVVPCSSMSVAYTGLAEGSVELATVGVAMSFLLAILAVPLWMAVFAAQRHVQLPIQDMLTTIATVLIAPMILGYLTRLGLTRWWGEKRYQQLQPLFPSLSLAAMFAIVFLIFFSKATMVIDRWQVVLSLLIPNALFMVVTLAVVTLVNRLLGLPYRDHMAVVFASTGKNNGTAIAIAATAFSPLVAIPAATMPIFQILFLVLYLKLASPLRRLFRPASRPEGIGSMAHPGAMVR